MIEGHDLFRFDLPYLVARARKAKTKLDWGRSGGFLRSRPSRLQIAEKTIDYPKFAVDGRHFVDTFLLAQFYDVGMRSLSGFERVDVAQHFGLCDRRRDLALTGKELQRAYREDAERFRKRALCAVRETRAVADLLSPSYFIQAQIFPYNYQDVIVRGNATRINALFLREYLPAAAFASPKCRWRAASKAATPRSSSPAWRATSGIATSPRSIRPSCCSSIASR